MNVDIHNISKPKTNQLNKHLEAEHLHRSLLDASVNFETEELQFITFVVDQLSIIPLRLTLGRKSPSLYIRLPSINIKKGSKQSQLNQIFL